MAKYEALRSFVGVNISASRGRIVELDEKAARELLRVGYVKAVAAEEPAPKPEPKEEPVKAPVKKKAPAKKKTAKKG